jgi:hypothetical protein
MMVRSTLLAWLLVLVAVPIGLRWSHRDTVLLDGLRRLSTHIGVARTVALPPMLITALMFSTWKQVAQSLYIVLTGQVWLRRINTATVLMLVCVCVPLAGWIEDSLAVRTALWHAIPGVLTTLVGLKLALLTRNMLSLWRERLIGDTALVLGATTWVAAVFAVYALLAWLAYGPVPPSYLLMLVAILVVPITRVSLAPLVLARSRHG